MNLFKLFQSLINPTFQKVAYWSKAYSDRSTGIRTPDSPTGFLAGDNGVAQLYSGVNKVIAHVDEGLSINGVMISIDGNVVKINTPTLMDFEINGSYLNPLVFDTKTKIVTTDDLGDSLVLTSKSFVDSTGSIRNTTQLSKILKFHPAFVKATPSLNNRATNIIQNAKQAGIKSKWLT